MATGGDKSRGFPGFIYPLNWQGERQTCLYVGDRQGGSNFNIKGYSDGIIEGTYRDYQVEGPFSERNYTFGLFEEDKCS